MEAQVEIAAIGMFQVVALALLAYFQSRNHAVVQDVKKEVAELKVNTDGKLNDLLKAREDAQGARGELKGRADARADAKDDAKESLPPQIERQEKE